MRRLSILLAIIVFLPGCSVYMASGRSTTPDLAYVKRGNIKADVDRVFKIPNSTTSSRDGKIRTDRYIYRTGDGPSTGWIVSHVLLDFFTLFCWEPFGTVIELITMGDRYELTVEYDENDVIQGIAIKQINKFF